MILGNHEFYGRKIDTEVAKLKAVAAAKRVTVLENEQAVVAEALSCALLLMPIAIHASLGIQAYPDLTGSDRQKATKNSNIAAHCLIVCG